MQYGNHEILLQTFCRKFNESNFHTLLCNLISRKKSQVIVKIMVFPYCVKCKWIVFWKLNKRISLDSTWIICLKMNWINVNHLNDLKLCFPWIIWNRNSIRKMHNFQIIIDFTENPSYEASLFTVSLWFHEKINAICSCALIQSTIT